MQWVMVAREISSKPQNQPFALDLRQIYFSVVFLAAV